MDRSVTFILTTWLVLLAQPIPLFAVDYEGAQESACFPVNTTASVDMNWIMSQKLWYYPLMSRLDLYGIGMDIAGKDAKDLREDELYYDFCPIFEISIGKVLLTGFGRIQKPYRLKHVKGMEIYEFYAEGHEDEAGTCYTTLTDNKLFAVDACCAPGNQMSWGVISKVKRLPNDTVKMIYDHVESLGFNREYFTGLRYKQCDNAKKNAGENLYNKLNIMGWIISQIFIITWIHEYIVNQK